MELVTKGIWLSKSEFTAVRTHEYLQRLLAGPAAATLYLPSLLDCFIIEGREAGWDSLGALASSRSPRALMILRPLFEMLRKDTLCRYPDLVQGQFMALAGLDDSADGYRARRSAALGTFLLGPFLDEQEYLAELVGLAHEFFELVSHPPSRASAHAPPLC